MVRQSGVCPTASKSGTISVGPAFNILIYTLSSTHSHSLSTDIFNVCSEMESKRRRVLTGSIMTYFGNQSEGAGNEACEVMLQRSGPVRNLYHTESLT